LLLVRLELFDVPLQRREIARDLLQQLGLIRRRCGG